MELEKVDLSKIVCLLFLLENDCFVELKHPRLKEPVKSTSLLLFFVQFRDLDAFSKLLLGQPMSDLVAKVTRTCDQRELEPPEIINELRRGKIVNTNLQEVLQAAKRAFSVSDSSGAMFKNLTEEMATKHPILEQLLREC